MRRLPQTRWIPKDAEAVEHSLGVAYKYTTERGAPAAVGYAGKANKASFHNVFIGNSDNVARRDQHIADFFRGLEQHAELVAKHKADRNRPHTLKVGDIVVNSWGWEQTNIDFFEIVSTTAHYVEMRKLQSSTEETGFMCGNTVPCPGRYVAGEEPIKAKASLGEYGNHINFKYGSGSVWDGKPKRGSWYA